MRGWRRWWGSRLQNNFYKEGEITGETIKEFVRKYYALKLGYVGVDKNAFTLAGDSSNHTHNIRNNPTLRC